MAIPRTRYLSWICETPTIDAKALESKCLTKLPKYTTANPVHAREVTEAVEDLRKHFRKADPPRPLNCMILGGPGSGKTFLAKELQAAVKAEYREYNLSQFHHPAEIQQCFVEAAHWLASNPAGKLLVFFDEFDVRIGGVSAIQYLIQPMYDGKVRFGGNELSLQCAAFVFSGSYLKERRVFESIVGGEQLDLCGVLFDTHRAASRDNYSAGYTNRIWQELLAVTAYDPIRQRLSPDRDVIAYVRSLDKIVDFASRMNGFVLELRNLNTPLHATRDHYRIELESESQRPTKALETVPETAMPDIQLATQLVTLVDGLVRDLGRSAFRPIPIPSNPCWNTRTCCSRTGWFERSAC